MLQDRNLNRLIELLSGPTIQLRTGLGQGRINFWIFNVKVVRVVSASEIA